MTRYDKEFQSNTPEFEEARKPLDEPKRDEQKRGDERTHGFEDPEPPKERRDEEK